MTDEQVEDAAAADPDAQPSSDEELRDAHRLYPPGSEPILLGLDTEVVEWFRRHGGAGDYRTRINQALKEYVATRR